MPPVARTASAGFSFADCASVYPDDDAVVQIAASSDVTLKRVLADELALFTPRAREWFASNFIAGRRDALYSSGQTDAVFTRGRGIAVNFPHLRIVVAKLFSVRVTSASAERLFFVFGTSEDCGAQPHVPGPV